MLYTNSIGNQPYNMMVVFKMRDSVPSARYSSVCNVLRQWSISLIPTYRIYRLYDRGNLLRGRDEGTYSIFVRHVFYSYPNFFVYLLSVCLSVSLSLSLSLSFSLSLSLSLSFSLSLSLSFSLSLSLSLFLSLPSL